MKLLTVMILMFLSAFAIAQVEQIDKRTLNAEMFKLDKLGNFYLVNENELSKTDKNLKTICTYDDFSWGNISLVDVSDPLQVLVFYKDFNRLIYLDVNLSELRDPVLLDDLEYYNVDVIASSQQSGFLIFNSQSSEVIQLDKNLTAIQKGNNLYPFTAGSEVVEMQVSTDFIVLRTFDDIIIILDKFANYYTQLAVKAGKPICLDNNTLYTLDGYVMSVLELNTKRLTEIKLPIANIVDFEVSGDKIYVLCENSLITFQIL